MDTIRLLALIYQKVVEYPREEIYTTIQNPLDNYTHKRVQDSIKKRLINDIYSKISSKVNFGDDLIL